jgi:putative peptidoglycan lipid II flippase
MLGGLLQLAIQVPALRAIGCLPRIGLAPRAVAAAWRHPGVKRVLQQMAPALLGVSVAQLSLLINTQIASHLRVGSVSWLTYADRLMEFPTALLGVALGVVLLPQLSSSLVKGDDATFTGMLDWGLRLVLLFTLPCAIALLIFPQALVAVLFHNGAFAAQDVQQTVRALQGYGVGLIGIVAIKVLAPGFYARQDIRTPVRIAIVVLVITQLMNVVFVPKLGHAGLALSIGLGAMVNAGLLLAGLLKRGAYRPAPGWLGFVARLLVANLALGVALWWAAGRFDWIALQSDRWLRAGLLAAVLGGVAALYFGVLLALGLRIGQFTRRV